MLESIKEQNDTQNQSKDMGVFPLFTDSVSNGFDDTRRDIYKSIADNTSDLICITTFSMQPVYTYVNPSYKRILGYEKEEIIGKKSFDFIHPDDRQALIPLLKKYMTIKTNNLLTENKEKIMERIDCRLKDKQGNFHFVEFTANLIGNDLLFIGKDKTENILVEKQVDREKAFAATIIQSIPGLFYVFDESSAKFFMRNDNFRKITGYSEQELDQMTALDFVVDRDLCAARMQEVYDKGYSSMENRLLTKSGEQIPYFFTGARFTIDTVRYLVGLGIDISERKRIEEAFEKRLIALTTPLDEQTHITFENLFNLDDIQRLQDEFSNATGVASIITQTDGTPITRPSNFCYLCNDIIRKTKQGRINCYKSDAEMGRYNPEGPIIAHCMSGGLWDAGASISVGGKHIANWLIGQVRDATQTEENMRAYARIIGADEDAMVKAFYKVPTMSIEQFGNIAQVLFTIANQLSDIAYQNVQQARFIAERKKNEQKITQAYDQLKESEEKYRTYINSAPYGIFICNEQGRYIDINDAATNMTGYTPTEILSKHFFDIIPVEGKDIARRHFQTLQETGKLYGKNQFIHKDGSLHWWIVNAIRLSDNRFLWFTLDITEKKRMEEAIHLSESKLKSIFENKGTAVGIFGEDNIITLCNSKFENLSGYTRDEIIGKMQWSDFVSSEDLERMRRYHIQRSAGKSPPTEYECSIYDKSGEKKSLIVNIGIIPETMERIVSLTDISQQKKAEEQLKSLNEHLEQKVQERTTEIQHLLRQKDEFINQLGHDLKNPLGPFMQLLPVLHHRIHDEKGKQIIEVLLRNTQYMRNLVKKNIDLAKLNSPNTIFSFNRESLYDLVSEVITINETLFHDHGITVENHIDTKYVAYVDYLHVQEIFTNLFNNAVKYMGGSGTVTIHAEPQEDMIVVSVADTGIGISAEQVDYLFDEYYKADESRHDFESSGLGLPICKRIVEKHGGRIWVESQGLGKGSIFYFSLPIHG